MEGPGEPPDPFGVDASAAFFGLWPKFAEPAEAERPGILPLRPRPKAIAHEQPRLRTA